MSWMSILGLSANFVSKDIETYSKERAEDVSWSAPILSWKKDVTPDQDNATNVESSAIAVWENELYFGTSHRKGVTILDRRNGENIGILDTKASVQSRPTIVNSSDSSTILAADISGTIYAWDAKTKNELWTVALNTPVNTEMTLYQDQLFIATNGDVVYSLSLDGEILWRYAHRADPSRKGKLQLLGAAKPLARQKDVVLGFSDGAVVRVDRKTADILEQVWNGSGRYPDIIAQPTDLKDGVLVSGFEKPTWKQVDKSVRWEQAIGGNHSALVLEEQNGVLVLHPGGDGILRKIDSTSGSVLWSWDSETGAALTMPQMTSSGVFVSSSVGGLWLIDPSSGEPIWTYQTDYIFAGAMHAPLIVDDQIFLLNKTGILMVFSALQEKSFDCPDIYCQWVQ